jgi:hypothetical protein
MALQGVDVSRAVAQAFFERNERQVRGGRAAGHIACFHIAVIVSLDQAGHYHTRLVTVDAWKIGMVFL